MLPILKLFINGRLEVESVVAAHESAHGVIKDIGGIVSKDLPCKVS